MSSIVNKVKDALNPHHSSGQSEGTSGPHNSRVGNAADPRVDSDRDHRAAGGIHSGTTTTGTTGTHGTTGLTGSHVNTGTTGLAGSHGTTGTTGNYSLGGDNRGLDGPASKTDGPHNSNLLNKADPRVDSDRDHSKNLGLNPSGTATTGNNTHTTGHTGTTGLGSTGHTGTHTTGTGFGSTGHTGTHSEGVHGPHSSRIANAADPRVDSDRDASRTVGGTTGTHGTTGLTGSHGTTGLTGSHGTTGHTGTHSEGVHGPHSSRIANAADPRVDSDRDASRTVGGTTGTHGTTGLTGSHGTSGLTGSHGTSGLTGSHGTSGLTGTTGHTGTHSEGVHGPHSSRIANAADPRVDSDRDASRTVGGTTGTHGTTGLTGTHGTTGLTGGTHATGPAPNTAGPHKSDALNKLDPRVDSDLDGSKTNTTGNAYAHKDPTDAAQVPPSVLQKHIGPPVVEHDDHSHDREKRHSISHQEEHRGL